MYRKVPDIEGQIYYDYICEMSGDKMVNKRYNMPKWHRGENGQIHSGK